MVVGAREKGSHKACDKIIRKQIIKVFTNYLIWKKIQGIPFIIGLSLTDLFFCMIFISAAASFSTEHWLAIMFQIAGFESPYMGMSKLLINLINK